MNSLKKLVLCALVACNGAVYADWRSWVKPLAQTVAVIGAFCAGSLATKLWEIRKNKQKEEFDKKQLQYRFANPSIQGLEEQNGELLRQNLQLQRQIKDVTEENQHLLCLYAQACQKIEYYTLQVQQLFVVCQSKDKALVQERQVIKMQSERLAQRASSPIGNDWCVPVAPGASPNFRGSPYSDSGSIDSRSVCSESSFKSCSNKSIDQE